MNELFSVKEIRSCAMKTYCMTYRRMCDIVENYPDFFDSYSDELWHICEMMKVWF